MKVYHWTKRSTAKLILKNGLRKGSWICQKPEDWYGEICLEIKFPYFDWNKMMYSWQATTHISVKPSNIKIKV